MLRAFDTFPDLATVYAAIPGPMMFGVVVGMLAPFVIGGWSRVRRWWFMARFQRRLARDEYMLVDEYRERAYAIGEEPPPIDWPAIAREAAVNALLLFAAGIMLALGREWQLEIALLGLAGLAMLYALWRRINDPETAPLTDTIPIEAVQGFVAAIALVAAVVAAIVLFV